MTAPKAKDRDVAAAPSGPESRRSGRRLAAALMAIFALGLGFRLIYILDVSDQPLSRQLTVDSASYDRWAISLAEGDWLGGKTFYQDPLYPYFLAAIYKVFGRNLPLVYVLQSVIAALAVFPLYGIGRRAFGDPRVGLLAALFWSLYKVDFFFDAQILKSGPGIGLTVLAIWSWFWVKDLERISPAAVAALGSGLLSGLLLLFRGNFFMVVAPVSIWLFVGLWRRRRGRALIPAGAFVLGILAVLVATGARNYSVSGEFTLTTAQGGVNFYVGNYRGNEWGAGRDPGFARRTPEFEESDFLAEARKRTGRPDLTPSRMSGFWYKEGMREIAADPGLFLARLVRKTLLVINVHEVSDNLNYDFFRERFSWILKLPLPAYWLAGPFGLAGMALALSRRRGGLLIIQVVSYGASLLVFYVVARYRMPMVPALLVFAAYGLVSVPALVRERDRRGLAVFLGCLVLAGGLGLPRWREPVYDVAWQKLGHAWARDGDHDRALESYDRALGVNPDLGQAWFGKGLSLEAQGRFDEALAAFWRAVALDPRHAGSHYMLGRSLERKGLGEEAARHYRMAAELDPGLADMNRR